MSPSSLICGFEASDILILKELVGVEGAVKVCEPSLGVLDITVFQVFPPSSVYSILTLEILPVDDHTTG
ncbi:MAG: hypothetical protein ABIL91_03905 [candidate division WOR-3 bacterium]